MVDSTRRRVVDAALEILSTADLRSLTVEEVAAAANVSRQTIYRHFGSRDGLVEALVIHVEQALTEEAVAAVERASSLEEAIRLAVGSLLAGARSHPLVDRLLQSDPGELLPLVVSGEGPVMSTAGPVVRDLMMRFLPETDAEVADRLADLLARLVISYTIAPGRLTPADAADGIAGLVMGHFAGGGGARPQGPVARFSRPDVRA